MTTITFSGLEALERRLTLKRSKLRTWRSLWNTVARDMAAAERKWFAAEGRGSWPALSENYATWKAAHYPGKTILVRDEELRDSLTSAGTLLQTRSADAATLATTVGHAIYHASRAPRSQLPRRDPFIPIGEARTIVRAALAGHLQERRGIPGPKPR